MRIEALKFALSANATLGRRRTNEDKRRCVEIALSEFPKLSSNAIAKMCGVSHTMINGMRPPELEDSSSSKRMGADGKERPAHRNSSKHERTEPEENNGVDDKESSQYAEEEESQMQ